jgi:hypothetical protein
MDYIEKDEQQHQNKDGYGFWNFKHIVGQEGPLRASDPEYKGSRYNVLIEWENGEITSDSWVTHLEDGQCHGVDILAQPILPTMPVIDPSELIGRTFLMDKEDGQGHHA